MADQPPALGALRLSLSDTRRATLIEQLKNRLKTNTKHTAKLDQQIEEARQAYAAEALWLQELTHALVVVNEYPESLLKSCAEGPLNTPDNEGGDESSVNSPMVDERREMLRELINICASLEDEKSARKHVSPDSQKIIKIQIRLAVHCICELRDGNEYDQDGIAGKIDSMQGFLDSLDNLPTKADISGLNEKNDTTRSKRSKLSRDRERSASPRNRHQTTPTTLIRSRSPETVLEKLDNLAPGVGPLAVLKLLYPDKY